MKKLYEGDPGTGSGGDETITLSGTYSFENDNTKELSFDNGNWKYYYNAVERQSGNNFRYNIIYEPDRI